ncbi:OmpA/MotB domain protein [Pirellula staleyi DSM 6068]|uniref:OmpA/MotB domain protein n=1 Tax=Pirellula staleyi (strain ATCC 27377 / DSM 6068 / ICPB 4128) TaxID=530564 RepID=D2R664_PIRSD|nr:OmpA family protein [Pirellula staleyi]ADB19149.1 OmpA/MotB domain protein [Pirellula staleyi DSM 6068]
MRRLLDHFRSTRNLLAAASLVCFLACGCKQGAFQPPAGTAQSNVFQQQSTALNSQVQDLTRRVGQLDLNNADLHRQLAQADQLKQQYADQVSLLQKQLGDMASRLKETQTAKAEIDKQVQTLQASTRFRGGASIQANSSATNSLSTVQIPGIDVRQDGSVIRIELPADKLFVTGSLQPTLEAQRIIDEVATAIIRSYPRQRIVIEGHTDNAQAGNPAGAHLLAYNQSQAVFQQLVQRNSIPVRQLAIAAMGENHPLASNGTEQGRAKNRRIEIVVYPDTIDG